MALKPCEIVKRRYHKMRRERRCVICGKKDWRTEYGATYCEKCQEKRSKYQKNRLIKKKAAQRQDREGS